MSLDSIATLNASHSIPGLASISAGINGLPKIRITTPAASAEIYLHGAHVTSFCPARLDDLLFLSRQSYFAPGKAIRGGIPICFPWFAKGYGPTLAPASVAQHGFARTTAWTLDAITEQNGPIIVTLSLESAPETQSLFPYNFRAEYRITIAAQLTLSLAVTNIGAEPFVFEEALHTYHRVGDSAQVRITGLDCTRYLDNRDDLRERMQSGDITFPVPPAAALDNIYLDTAASLTLHDPALSRIVTVDKHDSATTVVWNPGAEGAAALADMADDEWRSFACIEASNVKDFAIPLAPGETHTLAATIRVSPLAE